LCTVDLHALVNIFVVLVSNLRLYNVFLFVQDVVGIKEYGMDKLIQIAATQLSDQLPESREAARNLALELQVFYEKSQASTSDKDEGEHSTSPDAESWEAFCQSKLSVLSAQAILRVTSTTTKEGVTSAPKEGLAVGC